MIFKTMMTSVIFVKIDFKRILCGGVSFFFFLVGL